ncbi:NlpC/P60 family protein [Streptomyces sp. NPDC003077]|uniref:C40 family peptidase n=1 Tax=Streptomyces sp. NPDC003077 TaxID=3154443 RepID=UPI0033A9A5EB
MAACTAVALCVTGLLAGTAPAAYADPGPGGGVSSPGPRTGTDADDAQARGAKELEAVRKKIDALYRAAEKATDAYNGAKEQVERQQKEIRKLGRTIDRTQHELDELKRQIGVLASAQYRSGGIPDEARLLLHADPERFLDDAALIHKAQQAARGLLGQLDGKREDLDAYAEVANDRYERLEAQREKKEKAQRDIRAKLDAAKELESRLATEEKERLRKLEEEQALREQRKWLDSGVLKDIGGKASDGGKKALAFATAQIGKDYVWGAEGPDTFDCSGLTLRAWEAGGRAIPRTSQEQWRQLPHVDIEDMRPGDLIIYYDDASHVALYVGDGEMVHAPRPGRQVTLAGAGSMPILGVVRPDA